MKEVDSGASGDKRDFSNPMYEAMGAVAAAGASDIGMSNASSRSSTMSPSSDASASDFVVGGPAGRHSFENFEPPILAPSSVTHKSSPQLATRHKEVSPSVVDTGKDTQCLVEEDDSEC